MNTDINGKHGRLYNYVILPITYRCSRCSRAVGSSSARQNGRPHHDLYVLVEYSYRAGYKVENLTIIAGDLRPDNVSCSR